MRIYFERYAKCRIPDPDDTNFTYWINYKWNDAKQTWQAYEYNSGFFSAFDWPREMTDQEFLMIALKS